MPGTPFGNRRHDAPVSDASLRQSALERGGELTYTCTPPGSGVRIGIDRNEEDSRNGPERAAGMMRADRRRGAAKSGSAPAG